MDLTSLQNSFTLLNLAEKLGLQPERTTPRYVWYLCPFHEEQQASFVIDQQKRIAKCFNPTCIAYRPMDHVRLIQMVEHLPKEVAIDRLYQLAGIDRPIDSLHDVLHTVLMKLTECIDDPVPRMFFKERGITEQALKDLSVGYAPSFNHVRSLIGDLSSNDAAKLELFRTAMFDNAIIYPLFDGLGRMAGFRSRPFGASYTKYIANVGDFPLHPTRLYGMHLIRHSRQIILVEGPNDVLALRSHGIGNVAGLMGLNLKEIDTYLNNCGFDDIVLIADGDESGQIATTQAPDLVRVNQIPFTAGHPVDPDEFIRDHGVIAMAELINQAKWPFLIRLDSRLRNLPDTPTGKIMLIKSIARDLSDGLHPLILHKVQERIAQALAINQEDVVSIFDLADFDTSDLESKVVYHLAAQGSLSEDIKSRVNATMFNDPRLRKQFELLSRGLSPSDSVTPLDGLLVGDVDYFIELASRKQMKHVLHRLAYSISNLNEPVEEVFSRVLDQVARHSAQDSELLDANQFLSIGIQNAIERAAHPNELLGISLGKTFPHTNMILQGLRPNNLYILAASQGTGKSALGLEWGLDMAFRQQIPILWISLEMSPLEMSVRALSKLTGLSATNIFRGLASKEQAVQLEHTMMGNSQAPFYLSSCAGINIDQIALLVRKYKILYGIQAVFVDYLQLITGVRGYQTMYERVGHISNVLKNEIAHNKKIGVSVVAIAQLAKDAARRDSIPSAESVSESYKIAQDADVFMILKRLSEAQQNQNKLDGKDLGNMLLHIDKNRMGEGNKVLGLVFNTTNMTIGEVKDGVPYSPVNLT